jgi:glycerol kinase
MVGQGPLSVARSGLAFRACRGGFVTHLLALDQGTTSSRAIVFNAAGDIVAVSQREFKQHYPQPGWVEHNADEIWTSQRDVAVEAIRQAKLKAADITGIGITNQRETVVVWDRETGKPIHHAIVWQDRRTAAKCDQLRADGREPTVHEKTGLLFDPYFSGTKVGWLLDNVKGARSRATKGELAFGTIDSWLIYQLTGGRVHVTDASNASRTLLMNIHTGDWDDELLKILNVPREVLPEIRSSSEVYGEVDAVSELAGAPIGGIAGDQQAALFGQACFSPGGAKNTYGTGCFMLMNTGSEAVDSKSKLLTTVAWKLGDKLTYALEGGVFVVTGLGAPHWDPYARGVIVGITRGTTAAHIARAAVDSIAFQVADLADAMHSDAGSSLEELRVDGGASVNDALLQHQADIMQLPVVRPKVTETTALGAAYLAGLATGAWKKLDDIAHHWQVDRRFDPAMSADEAGALRARWSEAVKRSRHWAN